MNDWMLRLKAGDKVVVASRYGGSKVVTVAKILPTGRIRTSDGSMFKASGNLATADQWNGTCLEEYNAEYVARAKRHKMVRTLNDYRWDGQTTEVLEKVYALIHGSKP